MISEFCWNWLRRVLGDLFARCLGDEAGVIPPTYPIDPSDSLSKSYSGHSPDARVDRAARRAREASTAKRQQPNPG
ncbi:MAG: hypothetical protein F6K26_49725 [Moorea sp. SIO2I5]|nr:hypothetical protein [Moorena sp. SIO2I5]